MIAVDVALARVLDGLAALPGEMVSLPQALDRVLAKDCTARVTHPPLDVSSMDGYALRAEDGARPLRVVGESAAGHPFAGKVGPGQAVRIFTGAAMPDGADCVAMQEDCRRDGPLLSVDSTPEAGRFVRPAGMDFRQGDTLLTAGTVMGPRQIALAAAMNLPWVTVHRRPKVAILSTGDEIAMPGEELGATRMPSSNGPALAAMVAANGGEPVQLGVAADSRQSLETMLAAAQGCDLLVTSGGASVGDYDLVQDALAAQGLSLDFWKIAMRPGKPLMFGRLRQVPVLGLPGNPVAALVCAALFLRPMLRALTGRPGGTECVQVRLAAAMPANDARQDYVRARIWRHQDGTVLAQPLERQDSAMLSGLAAADGLIVRPPHAPPAMVGEAARVLPLDATC